MTRNKINQVQSIAFMLADGSAVAFPIIAPFVSAIEAIILAAENHGVVPVEMSVEQRNAIAAGMAAAKSSAVTEFIAKTYKRSDKE